MIWYTTTNILLEPAKPEMDTLWLLWWWRRHFLLKCWYLPTKLNSIANR